MDKLGGKLKFRGLIVIVLLLLSLLFVGSAQGHSGKHAVGLTDPHWYTNSNWLPVHTFQIGDFTQDCGWFYDADAQVYVNNHQYDPNYCWKDGADAWNATYSWGSLNRIHFQHTTYSSGGPYNCSSPNMFEYCWEGTLDQIIAFGFSQSTGSYANVGGSSIFRTVTICQTSTSQNCYAHIHRGQVFINTYWNANSKRITCHELGHIIHLGHTQTGSGCEDITSHCVTYTYDPLECHIPSSDDISLANSLTAHDDPVWSDPWCYYYPTTPNCDGVVTQSSFRAKRTARQTQGINRAHGTAKTKSGKTLTYTFYETRHDDPPNLDSVPFTGVNGKPPSLALAALFRKAPARERVWLVDAKTGKHVKLISDKLVSENR